MSNFWDFSVWGGVVLMATLFLGLLGGHGLKRVIPALKESLIPTSVLGGAILLIVAAIYKLITGDVFFNVKAFGGNGITILEIITYHTLALGFISSGLKKAGAKGDKERTRDIFNTGVATVCNYLLQAVFGFGITLLIGLFLKDFFTASGILLPFGYGQGTGQALNYGNIYETEYGFAGGKSFGLTIAALGFLSASIGGVIHLLIMKRKGLVAEKVNENEILKYADIQAENEIPMQESMDKMTIQVAFVVVTYLITYLLMYVLGNMLPGMRSVIYGFNFLLGVLSAVLVKAILNLLQKKKIVKREYINNFLMTRVSNFFFDVMVVAGIAAIRIEVIADYWIVILVLGVVGAVVTYFYDRLIAKKLFKAYEHEQFLMMYGMYTGTASTGVILLREIDSEFKTPAADNMVYQNFPAIVFGFPMMLLANLAPKEPVLTYACVAVFFVVMNVILFRSFIFKKKAK